MNRGDPKPHPFYDTPAHHFHWQATCLAHDGSVWLRRCGAPTLHALVVCAEHFEQHGAMLPTFIRQWWRANRWLRVGAWRRVKD
jgi:hypothetical protein